MVNYLKPELLHSCPTGEQAVAAGDEIPNIVKANPGKTESRFDRVSSTGGRVG